jgi:hypothetical protein
MDLTNAQDDDMYGQPITPVLKYEEDKMGTLISRFQRSRTQRNQDNDHRGSLNYTLLPKGWNSQCLNEMAKPIEQREKMYPKTPQLVRVFYKEMLRRKNDRANLRHTVEIREDSGGGVQSVTVRQGVHHICGHFRREDARVTIAAAQQAHAVIDSRGGIWTKSAVRRRARLTVNQDNETNASISNSRYRSNISVRVSRITDTVRPKRFLKKLCES